MSPRGSSPSSLQWYFKPPAPSSRDVFSTGTSTETRIAIRPIMDRIYKSFEGHVVVRIAPGGMTYEVFVLDDKDMQRKVYSAKNPNDPHYLFVREFARLVAREKVREKKAGRTIRTSIPRRLFDDVHS